MPSRTCQGFKKPSPNLAISRIEPARADHPSAPAPPYLQAVGRVRRPSPLSFQREYNTRSPPPDAWSTAFDVARKDDIRDQPAYTLAEAARYLKVAPATLRSWVIGRPYQTGKGPAHFKPLIRPASNPPPMLSFWNLIEAHVLRALRTDHGVKMDALRTAIQYAQRSLDVDRLLLSPELRTDAGKLLLARYGELIELSASGQVAMRRMFNEHLARVEWDNWQFPVKLYPATAETLSGARPIAIDAQVAFGRPVIAKRGITTSAIADRIDSGETVDDLAADYDLSVDEIEEAVLYERAA